MWRNAARLGAEIFADNYMAVKPSLKNSDKLHEEHNDVSQNHCAS
jgi:hypothetical protein